MITTPPSQLSTATGFKIQINVSEGNWRDVLDDAGEVEVYEDRQRARREANELNDSEDGTYRAVPVGEPSVA